MGEGRDIERVVRDAEAAQGHEDDDKQLVVVRMPEEESDEADRQEEIEHPAKLIRIATMIQRMLLEVHDVDLDEASRRRLVDIYQRTLQELGEVLSEDLREELTDMVFHELESEEPPSQAEIRVVHAQLIGWLEGLFHGIQASLASQQLSATQQLARLRSQPAIGPGKQEGEGPPGQYL
ncbi:MAG: proteasome activator [Nitriliruptorales bacterium]